MTAEPDDAPRPLPRTAPVLPGETIAGLDRSWREEPRWMRFEFSRNDARLNAVELTPLMGSRQWLEPPRPRERPVQFHRWRQ